MAQYKKKNVKKLKAVKPRKKTVAEGYKITTFGEAPFSEDIPIKSASEAKAERKNLKKKQKYLSKEQPKKRVVYSNKTPRELNNGGSGFKVVSGTKRAKLIKKASAISLGIVLIISIVATELMLPIGIAESLSNAFAKSGKGSGFPITVNGGKIHSVSEWNGCISTLSDTYFEVYNPASKEMISEQHGLATPAISTSQSRALLFDKGGEELAVYKPSGLAFRRNMKQKIITAAVGRGGAFAVATLPEDNASKLWVYSNDNKKLFSYEFDFGLVNSLSVSHSGKTVAVSSVNAEGGAFKTDVIVFDLKSGKKLFQKSEKELVYSILPLKSGYALSLEGGVSYLNETDGMKDDAVEGGILMTVSHSSGSFGAILGTPDSDDNVKAIIHSSSGEKLFSSQLSGAPDSFAFNSDFAISAKDNSLEVFNIKTKQSHLLDVGFVCQRFALVGDKVFVMNNSILEEMDINPESEEK